MRTFSINRQCILCYTYLTTLRCWQAWQRPTGSWTQRWRCWQHCRSRWQLPSWLRACYYALARRLPCLGFTIAVCIVVVASAAIAKSRQGSRRVAASLSHEGEWEAVQGCNIHGSVCCQNWQWLTWMSVWCWHCDAVSRLGLLQGKMSGMFSPAPIYLFCGICQTYIGICNDPFLRISGNVIRFLKLHWLFLCGHAYKYGARGYLGHTGYWSDKVPRIETFLIG